MRIILLSVAFLFLAFSVHSQVLKSAGVWYFLDVDSMTARPAVLPNGTELAYVVGTKKIYYWDRVGSTWTEYSTGGGSSFNRDSIYFDSSIVGSGTLGDPWRVDSTFFATIAGVGDSIAAALGAYVEIADTAAMLTRYIERGDTAAMLDPYFLARGGRLTGTAGAGFVGFPTQSSVPSTPANGFSIFGDNTGRFSWLQSDGYIRTLISPTAVADRGYRFQNKSYTLADSADVAALPTGSGTTNYYAKWSSGTALGIGNLFDNNTYVGILNSKPFQFGQWTTAGRPTGAANYFGWRDGTTFEWYNGTRWGAAAESVTSTHTVNEFVSANSNGQLVSGRTDGAKIPVGTTAQRLTAANGNARYNTTYDQVEFSRSNMYYTFSRVHRWEGSVTAGYVKPVFSLNATALQSQYARITIRGGASGRSGTHVYYWQGGYNSAGSSSSYTKLIRAYNGYGHGDTGGEIYIRGDGSGGYGVNFYLANTGTTKTFSVDVEFYGETPSDISSGSEVLISSVTVNAASLLGFISNIPFATNAEMPTSVNPSLIYNTTYTAYRTGFSFGNSIGSTYGKIPKVYEVYGIVGNDTLQPILAIGSQSTMDGSIISANNMRGAEVTLNYAGSGFSGNKSYIIIIGYDKTYSTSWKKLSPTFTGVSDHGAGNEALDIYIRASAGDAVEIGVVGNTSAVTYKITVTSNYDYFKYTTTTKFRLSTSGLLAAGTEFGTKDIITGRRFAVNDPTPDYSGDFGSNTDAIELPIGTTAQTPTEVGGVIRFNSDSTLYQIYSGGVRSYIATRAYARSLVSALPTTNIYTANGTLTGDRTITSGGFDLRYTGNFSVGSSSAPARTLDVTGEARISDLTTDTPTRIVGADGDGDLGAITLSSDISITSGTLGVKNLYNSDGTIPDNTDRTINIGTDGDDYIAISKNPNQPETYIQLEEGNNSYYGYEWTYNTGTGSQPRWTGVWKDNFLGNNGAGVHSEAVYFNSFSRVLAAASIHTQITDTLEAITRVLADSVANSVGAVTTVMGSLPYAGYYAHNVGIANGDIGFAQGGTRSYRYGNNRSFQNGSLSNFRIQTTNTINNNGYDWFGVYDMDNFTASRTAIGFYNDSYRLPNASPAAGTGLKQNIVWTAGTPAFEYVKKDTTIYVTDADYNFSAAVTSANILLKFNRIIIYSKLSASASSDNQIILHSASSDFLQCEIIIYSNDASADADATSIDFTTNGAVDGAGGTASAYSMVGGQRVNIRAVNDVGYKWIYN